jgi:hypothetical protein
MLTACVGTHLNRIFSLSVLPTLISCLVADIDAHAGERSVVSMGLQILGAERVYGDWLIPSARKVRKTLAKCQPTPAN